MHPSQPEHQEIMYHTGCILLVMLYGFARMDPACLQAAVTSATMSVLFIMATLRFHAVPSIPRTVVLLICISPADDEQQLDINFVVFANTGTRPR